MEDMSIYDYIQENISTNGRICPDCKMKEYIAAVYNREYEADIYNSFCKLTMWDVKVDNSIERVEFKIYPIIERLLDTLDNTEIETYLKDKELNIRIVIDQVILTIEKKIENIDKKKLADFCKENILKTQNMHCMYIYLILASYTDLKNNESLQNVILKVGLMEEYTLFLNQYILDKFPYPEYSRFYLVKRIVDARSKYVADLLQKVSFENDEIKYWTIEKYTSEFSDEGIKDIFWNLDLVKIIKDKELDLDMYKKIGITLKNLLHSGYLMDSLDGYKKFFLEYIERFEDFDNDIDSLLTAGRIYILIYKSEHLSNEVKDEIISKYKRVLDTDETISLIKEKLENPDTEPVLIDAIHEFISALNISQLYLDLFNSFKNDPIDKASWLRLFEFNKEVHKQAIKILYEKIDWDNIIGEYSALRRHTFKPDPVKFLLYSVGKYPELAYQVFTKTLRSKKLEHRFITVHELFLFMHDQEIMYEFLPKELRESIEYQYEHEPDIICKNDMELILGRYSEDEIQSDIACKFTVIKKSDEEFLEEERKDEIEYEERNRINLNDHILSKLDMYIGEKGVNAYISGKVIYYKRIKNSVTAWCQGEKFGKEYVVRLIGDKNAQLIETNCTCGKNDPKDKDHYCKHVAATLIYLSKINDKGRRIYM